jgi:hypothetical protein
MNTVLRARYIAAVLLVGLGLWMWLKPTDWQNWLGFSHNAYFVWGTNYALFSGFLPCTETGVGLSTIIIGFWHHVNCHVDGCPLIVRHKIANGEYGVCGRHWREINGHGDEPHTVEHIRAHHHRHLAATGRSQ